MTPTKEPRGSSTFVNSSVRARQVFPATRHGSNHRGNPISLLLGSLATERTPVVPFHPPLLCGRGEKISFATSIQADSVDKRHFPRPMGTNSPHSTAGTFRCPAPIPPCGSPTLRFVACSSVDKKSRYLWSQKDQSWVVSTLLGQTTFYNSGRTKFARFPSSRSRTVGTSSRRSWEGFTQSSSCSSRPGWGGGGQLWKQI